MPAAAAISVRDLRKAYNGVEAVRGISFDVHPGEVFGILGPNGAGKTSTVEILEGYRTRDAGDVEVLGYDPQRAGRDFRERIGIVLQQSEPFWNLTVREMHRLFAGYYDRPRDVDEVIALVGDPELVFLDEPTTGFDPAARRAAWEMIRSLRELGKTVLLTTHYLDEAQQLADRVAVLRDGEIVRSGSPAELTASTKARIRFVSGGEETVIETEEPTAVLHRLTGEALAAGRELQELEVRRATLEDVYLDLVTEEGDE